MSSIKGDHLDKELVKEQTQKRDIKLIELEIKNSYIQKKQPPPKKDDEVNLPEMEDMAVVMNEKKMRQRFKQGKKCILCDEDDEEKEMVQIICKDSHCYHKDCFRKFQELSKELLIVVKCPKCYILDQEKKYLAVCQVQILNPKLQHLTPFLIDSVRFGRPNDMGFCDEVEIKPDFYAPRDPIYLEHLRYEPHEIDIQINFRKELVELLQSDVMARKELDDIKKGNRYKFQSKTINSNTV